MNNFEYQRDLEKYIDEIVLQFESFKSECITPYMDINGKRFLEIGYGGFSEIGGIFMSLFYKNGAARPVYGIDVAHPFFKRFDERSIKFWEIAKEKYGLIQDSDTHLWSEHSPPIVKMHMNSESMYLKNELVDIIYSTAVLEHIKNPELAFREMYRVLAPGGIAVHVWNPFTSLLMGGHDIGIPYYYPWAHLRLNKADHVQKLKEVFSNDHLRTTASVQEHTVTADYLNSRTVETIYDGILGDLNKIRIKKMCMLAVAAGFTITFQKVNYYDEQSKEYLTDEIKQELSQYSEDELLCSSHQLILSKPKRLYEDTGYIWR